MAHVYQLNPEPPENERGPQKEKTEEKKHRISYAKMYL